MANWLVVIDDDCARRDMCVREASLHIAPVEGLQAGTLGADGWSVVWAKAPSAPMDVAQDATGSAALWGEPIDGDAGRISAVGLRAAWRDGAVAQWDGFYAALVVEQLTRRVTVGADVLGIFPIYYWSDEAGVVLCGTSPELFRHHDRFVGRVDPEGLAGILLTNGLVGGRALWQGVRRLGAGCRLRIEGTRVREERAYQIPDGLAAIDLPLAGHVRQLTQVIGDAVKRHVPSGVPYGLLLSGGLDSRMMAGFLQRAAIRPRALTLGLPTDLEMRCAKAVADTYGLEHVTAEPAAEAYPAYARIHATWEHLANGFNTIRDWWTLTQVAPLGDRLVTGGLSDSVVGGTSIPWAYDDSGPAMTYEAFVRQMPRMSVPPDVVRSLLDRPAFAGAVESVERRLETEFHEYGTRRSYSAWRYDLAHGQRYHVGATAWRLAFGAWPVLPMLDRRVIETAANIPASSLSDRAAQLALVETQLPELASVPLDRSDLMSDEPQYLSPRLRHLLESYARGRLRRVRKLVGMSDPDYEARYWYRINNLNGEAWQRVRSSAEPDRGPASAILNRARLDEILPPAPTRTGTAGPRVPESGRKLLLGFIHWAGTHLDRA